MVFIIKTLYGGTVDFKLENKQTKNINDIDDHTLFEDDTTILQIKEYIKTHILKDTTISTDNIILWTDQFNKIKDDIELDTIKFKKKNILFWSLKKETKQTILKIEPKKALFHYDDWIYKGDYKQIKTTNDYHQYPFGKGEMIHKHSGIILIGFFDDYLDFTKKITLIYPNKLKYIGYINKDFLLEGDGMLIFPTGEIITALFENNNILFGNLQYPNKNNIYTGQIKLHHLPAGIQYELLGYGIYKNEIGVYSGNFKNNSIIYGTFKSYQDNYIGYFNNYLFNGEGTLIFKNTSNFKTYLKGTFKDNIFIEGSKWSDNILEWPYDDVYTGKFINDTLNGLGTLKLRNGDIYKGIFENDIFISGLLNYYNNDIYIGAFNIDVYPALPNGLGLLLISDSGDIYEGLFEDGVLVNGKLTYKTGEIYEGTFSNELYPPVQNGEGKLINSDGVIFEGYWINGVFNDYDDDYFEEQRYDHAYS